MDHFHYRQQVLYCEDVSVPDLASAYGTPLFVYSEQTLCRHLAELQRAFADSNPLVCYSIKTNPNLSIIRLMLRNGAGCDVTSAGELYRALRAGCPPERIVFAGVAKTDEELRYGLDANVLMFNVESAAELEVLGSAAAALGKTANVALRVNPALPPKTHAKTDTSVKGVKFGLDIDSILEVAQGVVGHGNLNVVGLHMHLGSPILSAQPYRDGVEKGLALIQTLRQQGHPVRYLNMGGGFGIHYRKHEALPADVFADAIVPIAKESGCQLVLEPGRFIVGNSGILVSRVIYTKESGGKSFIIQDAGMNDLIRPTLYDAFHRIWPVTPPADVATPPADYEVAQPHTRVQDVVGPICETSDFLARERHLPEMKRGDLLATFTAGAYGMAMSSNYNGRPRAAEVLVKGGTHRLIRRRETLADLIVLEEPAALGDNVGDNKS